MENGRDYPGCGALLCGFMLDLDGADRRRRCAPRHFDSPTPTPARRSPICRPRLPLFIARAGQDQFAGVNDSIDRFMAAALARNQPITFVNHADGPHAFDLLDDTATSRAIIRQTLDFLTSRLAR